MTVIDVKRYLLEIVESRGSGPEAELILDSIGEAGVEGTVECGVIPVGVRGVFGKFDHVFVEALVLFHAKLLESLFGRLNEVGFAK